MKIAVPVNQNGQIDEHFGHCNSYSIYTLTEKGEIADLETIQAGQGCGCKSNISSILASLGVSVMLAGGIGGGAINVLNNSGIQVIRGCSGEPAELVQLFAAGKITDSGETCTHHEHHQGN